MKAGGAPEVTVGIPFHDAGATLEDALRSVSCQTFTGWELILVNDGSRDDGPDLARRAAAADPRIRFVDDHVNRGLPARLNQIASLARAPLLARMDADDLMHPDRLRRQVEVLQSDPAIDIVNVAMYMLSHGGEVVGVSPRRLPAAPLARLQYNTVNHAAVTGRTAWFRAHPYDESYLRAQDMELWVRTADAVAIHDLDEPLHFSRQDPTVIPAGKYARTAAAHRRIIHEHGPGTVGWVRTAYLLGWVQSKRVLYGTLRRAGRPAVADRFRYRPLAPAQRQAAAAALGTIAGHAAPWAASR